MLRRSQAHPPESSAAEKLRAYRFAGWEFDVRTRKLSSPAGSVVELTNAEFGLLTAFLIASQRILSRDQLLELSKGYNDDVFDRSIDVQILRLRRKIEADPSRPELIKTERGAGYLFAAPVTKL